MTATGIGGKAGHAQISNPAHLLAVRMEHGTNTAFAGMRATITPYI